MPQSPRSAQSPERGSDEWASAADGLDDLTPVTPTHPQPGQVAQSQRQRRQSEGGREARKIRKPRPPVKDGQPAGEGRGMGMMMTPVAGSPVSLQVAEVEGLEGLDAAS